MKMAKKLLAVVLAGVMAVSMLTGCASISSRRVADELEGMLKAANDKATVKAVDDDLANKAVKVAKEDNKDALKADAALKAAVKTELTKDNKLGDSYIWIAYFATKDVNKTVKAQNIAVLTAQVHTAVEPGVVYAEACNALHVTPPEIRPAGAGHCRVRSPQRPSDRRGCGR